MFNSNVRISSNKIKNAILNRLGIITNQQKAVVLAKLPVVVKCVDL